MTKWKQILSIQHPCSFINSMIFATHTCRCITLHLPNIIAVVSKSLQFYNKLQHILVSSLKLCQHNVHMHLFNSSNTSLHLFNILAVCQHPYIYLISFQLCQHPYIHLISLQSHHPWSFRTKVTTHPCITTFFENIETQKKIWKWFMVWSM